MPWAKVLSVMLQRVHDGDLYVIGFSDVLRNIGVR